MIIVKSNNFDLFSCIADKCPCSCCKGWEIVIDEDKLDEYAGFGGSIASKLANSIDWENSTFKQHDGSCAMLNEDGLCSLQLAAGEGALCKTCTLYPRHVEEYEDVREWSLSLSCPEAARIILSREDRIEFIEEQTDEEDDFEEFDYFLYSGLVGSREAIYEVINDRTMSFEQKADILTGLAAKLQQCIDEDRIFEIEETAAHLRDYNDNTWKEKRLFSKLFELEFLDSGWLDKLDVTWKNWDELELTQLSAEDENYACQLLMFWVYTYYCGAVYDDMILSKLLLAVCSTYWILKIAKATQREEISKFDNTVLSAYSYAREIEHSDLNLDYLEEWFEKVFL